MKMKSPLNLSFIFLVWLFVSCGGGQTEPQEMAAPEETTTDTQTGKAVEEENQAREKRRILEEKRRQSLEQEQKRIKEQVMSREPVTQTDQRKNNQTPLVDQPEAGKKEQMVRAQTKKLAVYCPRKMIYKESSDVIGFVADLIADEVVKQMMQNRVSEATGSEVEKPDDKDMLIRELQLFQFLELRLDDSDNEGFSIKKIHDSDIQQVASNMEGWHWKVTPTTSDKQQQLVLKVVVYDNQKKRLDSFDKTYKIDVKIESARFVRNTYALFVENPEWAFAAIITPILTFLWGRFLALRRKKKKSTT